MESPFLLSCFKFVFRLNFIVLVYNEYIYKNIISSKYFNPHHYYLIYYIIRKFNNFRLLVKSIQFLLKLYLFLKILLYLSMLMMEVRIILKKNHIYLLSKQFHSVCFYQKLIIFLTSTIIVQIDSIIKKYINKQ